MSAGLAPGCVPWQALGQVFPGGFELVSDEPQPEEPAAEGVLRVVGFRAPRGSRARFQSLVGNGHGQLDEALDFPCVQAGVEGPELDGPLLENAVQVEQVRWRCT